MFADARPIGICARIVVILIEEVGVAFVGPGSKVCRVGIFKVESDRK